MRETKTYHGATGGTGGFDGYAGLVVGTTYTGEIAGDRVAIVLPNGRPTSVSLQEWRAWFR